MTITTSPERFTISTSGSLAGKVAVITGAARGIGYEVAKKYAAHGAVVVVSDINEDAAASAAQTLPNATAVRCDVRDEVTTAALFDHVLTEHGKIDIVVANAGIATLAPLLDMPFDMWRQMMSINLDGVFLTVQHGARAMIASQVAGSIITMASVTALAAVPLAGHYAAAKAGVVNLTKTAALELRPAGIRVNAILPGFVETELVTGNRELYNQALGIDFDDLLAQTQGGYVTVDDVADLAVFLAGDRAQFSTGGAFVVDGGLSASLF
ncbi:oxidoreductase [Mycobacterium intermedium]|uniref:Oxidoreductase n=1 Tax=Mycobacterium intermedium TaxID=28445 RepID=A0A1E3SIH2_MYCIE|nr:SDR family NAD(P)-dependent oxidoreductase [Mycobacterium intermedium]MCV6964547.1 SDR family oxidoreductase [Mycobacterium intermedium]ODR01358.1 oxidoreductase [Mycobacterium intermedium]OPE52543.1 oxidoreductase [Mycobacterium intermedium]ORB07470.1 oxidoreductase [Mycobacterium intermedium]